MDDHALFLLKEVSFKLDKLDERAKTCANNGKCLCLNDQMQDVAQRLRQLIAKEENRSCKDGKTLRRRKRNID